MEDIVDSLISGYKWNVQTVTYGTPNSINDFGEYVSTMNVNSFTLLSDKQKVAISFGFDLIESYTGINVFYVESNAIINIGNIQYPTAFAFYPGSDLPLLPHGDIWFGNSNLLDGVNANQNASPGNYGWHVILHEIGHSFGLKHPHETPIIPSENGGPGKDTLFGGLGSDMFVFSNKRGVDKIEDFETSIDKIVLDRDLYPKHKKVVYENDILWYSDKKIVKVHDFHYDDLIFI